MVGLADECPFFQEAVVRVERPDGLYIPGGLSAPPPGAKGVPLAPFAFIRDDSRGCEHKAVPTAGGEEATPIVVVHGFAVARVTGSTVLQPAALTFFRAPRLRPALLQVLDEPGRCVLVVMHAYLKRKLLFMGGWLVCEIQCVYDFLFFSRDVSG